MAEQRTVNPLVVGSSPTRGAGRLKTAGEVHSRVRRRSVLSGFGAPLLPMVAALALATPLGAEEQSPAGDDEPTVDFHLRLRGRFLDQLSDLGDTGVQRLSVWTDTRIGDRFQTRATYDVGETRIHDLWAQYDAGGGIRIRAGRSAPLWLAEFTDAPFSFQMVGAAVGAALTQVRETGLFLFADRGPYNARLHVVNGSGWQDDPNGWKDVLGSVGRRFEAAGSSWKLDAGHYEGRDGADDALIPRRQTGFHLDGDLGCGRFFRGAAFRREQDGREHFGGFARLRNRFPQGVWAALELGSESNRGGPENPGHASYLLVGTRYELPWTLTHLTADYRRRFGTVSDHELLVVFQWVLDFRNPRRN